MTRRVAGTSSPSAGRLALVIRHTSNNETMSVFKRIFIVSLLTRWGTFRLSGKRVDRALGP
jgi:hypothetical protein